MQFKKLCKINLITGSLGAGKTTLIRNLIEQKPENETWQVIVNEFGAIGIDQAILSTHSQIEVSQLVGGCICCTNQAELTDTLSKLTQNSDIDRIIIEPTGIGEPDALIDIIHGLPSAERFDIQTIISMFDLSDIDTARFESFSYLKNLLNAADLIVFNKRDLVDDKQVQALQNYCQALYPPKEEILFTENGQIPIQQLNLNAQRPFKLHKHSTHAHESCALTLPIEATPIKGLIERKAQSSNDFITIGWLFDEAVRFDWKKVKTLIETAQQNEAKLVRAKGLFRLGKSSMLFQMVHNKLTRDYISYRRDSRFEIILQQPFELDITKLEQQLQAAIL